MRNACSIALMLAIVGFTVTAAPAPEARPLGGLEAGVWLILRTNDPRIHQELKLTESQVKKIEELNAERQGISSSLKGLSKEERTKKLQDLRELNKAHVKAIIKILTKRQIIRAEQIYLQRIGPYLAFRGSPVAAALKLTEEQKDKMTLIRKESFQERSLLTPRGGGGRELMQKLAELRKKEEETLLNVLTPSQKTKWAQLLGKPFKLEPRLTEEKKQPSQGSDKPRY